MSNSKRKVIFSVESFSTFLHSVIGLNWSPKFILKKNLRWLLFYIRDEISVPILRNFFFRIVWNPGTLRFNVARVGDFFIHRKCLRKFDIFNGKKNSFLFDQIDQFTHPLTLRLSFCFYFFIFFNCFNVLKLIFYTFCCSSFLTNNKSRFSRSCTLVLWIIFQ